MNTYQINEIGKKLAKVQAWLPIYKVLKLLIGTYLALKICAFFINQR